MNHDFHVRVAEIRVNQDTDTSNLVEFFHVESGKEHPLHLLAMVEIHSTSYIYERLLDTLYTSLQQAKTFVSGMDGDPMIRFEKIVQRVNEALSTFAKMEGDALQWNLVNLFLFQVADHHLCFSGIGSISNVFFQKQSEGQSKAFDLLGSLEQPESVHPAKPLSSIVCGAMQVGDVLFFGSQNLQAVREQIGITDICRTLPPVSAATEIEQRLQHLGTSEMYFGVVVAAVQVNKPKAALSATPITTTEPVEDLQKDDSIEHLYKTEQATEHLLDHGDSEHTSLMERAQKTVQRLSTYLRTPKTIAKHLATRPLSALSITASASSVTRSLGKNRQTAFILGGVALLILVGGGLFVRHTRQKQEEQRVWTAVFEQATEAKNRAESAIVYADEQRARTQLAQAIQSLSELNTETSDRAEAKAGLEKSVQELQSRLRRERVVQTPSALVDLTSVSGNTQAQGLVIQGAYAYSIDTANNTLLRIALDGGAVDTFTAPENSTLALLGSGAQAPTIYTQEKTFLTLRSGALVPLRTTLSKASSTDALVNYGQRIYTLDRSAGTIWRWNAGTSLSGETAYLTTPSEDLRRGTAIAIDANVYASTEDGQILKFLGGKREAWSPATIDPPLTNAASLWTSADSSNIVVLDRVGKRVVVFSKEGRLLGQITSPAFTDLRALSVDIAKKKIYVLNDKTVYNLEAITE